jgi:hypothetical protein
LQGLSTRSWTFAFSERRRILLPAEWQLSMLHGLIRAISLLLLALLLDIRTP